MMVLMATQQALNLKDELAGYEFDNANFSFTESAVTVIDWRIYNSDISYRLILSNQCIALQWTPMFLCSLPGSLLLQCHVKCHVLSWFLSKNYWIGLLPHLTPKEIWIRQMRRRARTTFTAVVNRLKEKEPSSENLTIFWLDGKLMTSLSLI